MCGASFAPLTRGGWIVGGNKYVFFITYASGGVALVSIRWERFCINASCLHNPRISNNRLSRLSDSPFNMHAISVPHIIICAMRAWSPPKSALMRSCWITNYLHIDRADATREFSTYKFIMIFCMVRRVRFRVLCVRFCTFMLADTYMAGCLKYSDIVDAALDGVFMSSGALGCAHHMLKHK